MSLRLTQGDENQGQIELSEKLTLQGHGFSRAVN
jgi:hypothetical protein